MNSTANSTTNSTSLVQTRAIKRSDPCWTSSGEGCKTYNVDVPVVVKEDPRIGYYTPDGEWIVPKGLIYNKTFGANTTEAAAI